MNSGGDIDAGNIACRLRDETGDPRLVLSDTLERAILEGLTNFEIDIRWCCSVANLLPWSKVVRRQSFNCLSGCNSRTLDILSSYQDIA